MDKATKTAPSDSILAVLPSVRHRELEWLSLKHRHSCMDLVRAIGLKRLPFIANSDFHRPKHIYSWKTLLYCAKDPEAIKQCIRTNRDVAITLFRKGQEKIKRGIDQDARSSIDVALPEASAAFN